jgi:type IV pilus assembly protein PilV
MKMKRNVQGFTLIEVLIAVLVVSFGMLGIASVLFASMRSATSNYTRQVAAAYAYDIIDRMRANNAEAALAGGAYTVAMGTTITVPTSCVAATCTAAEMAAYDIWEWEDELKNTLPSGEGSVAIAAGSNSTYTVTVTVQWADTAGATAFSSASNSNSTSTTTTTNGTNLGAYTVVTAL